MKGSINPKKVLTQKNMIIICDMVLFEPFVVHYMFRHTENKQNLLQICYEKFYIILIFTLRVHQHFRDKDLTN